MITITIYNIYATVMNLEEEEKGLKDIKHVSCMILYRLDKIHPDSIFMKVPSNQMESMKLRRLGNYWAF